MTPTEIASAVVSLLTLASRFLDRAKPAWWRLPKPIALAIPPTILLIPEVVAVATDAKDWGDLVTYIISAVALVLGGLFPNHPPAPERKAALQARAQAKLDRDGVV